MKSRLRILILPACLGVSLLACRPAGTSTGSGETSPSLTSSALIWFTDNVPAAPHRTPRPTRTPPTTVRPSPTPQPTPVPWSGWLLFSSRREDANGDGAIGRGDASHLYTIDPAGTIVQLTSGDYSDAYPSWSPHRSHIAFVSGRGGKGDFDLFVIAADGSGLVQLTDTPGREIEPVWSPDGAQIAYVTVTPDELGLEERRLYLISASSRISQQLTYGPGNDWHPDWSPDGRFLAFDRIEPEGDRSVYLWVVETGSFTRLEFPGESRAVGYDCPRWLPRDGNLLSVIRSEYGGDVVSSQIVVFQVEEREGEIALHQTLTSIETNFFHYTWGPNGEWLIAPVKTGPQSFNLLRMRVSLESPSRACWGCTDLLDAEFLTEGDYYDDFPDWAP